VGLLGRTKIDVIGTHDVVLGQIAADLERDDLKWDLSGIFYPIPLACLILARCDDVQTGYL
jgi:hypothetical protein